MAANAMDTIMLFGDSITQAGWQPYGIAQRLAYVYARRLDVLNRGLSGYNTEWALPILEQVFAKKSAHPFVPHVPLLTIWFGANDACIPPSPQHVPLSKFKNNLAKMVRLVKAPESEYYSPRTRILLFTPPPINTIQRAADLQSRAPPLALDRDFETTRTYANAVKEVGQNEDVSVLDVWTALWEAAGRDESSLKDYLVDGLHLSDKGYSIVYDILMEKVSLEFPDLHYEKLPLVFPHWTDINREDPRASLKSNRIELVKNCVRDLFPQ